MVVSHGPWKEVRKEAQTAQAFSLFASKSQTK